MGRLTSRPLYEWEQIAKKRNWDIDKLREAYWDELTAEGRPGVKEQAKRLRGAGLPVGFDEGPSDDPKYSLGAVQGTAMRSVPRAWEEALTMALAGGAQMKGIPPNVSSNAPVMEAVKKASEESQEFVGDTMGFPEMADPKKFWSLYTIPYMLAQSAGYLTMPIGSITKGAAPASRAARAAIEAAGFGGMSTAAGLTEGEAPEDALEQGLTTAGGVLGLHALGAGAGKAFRKLVPKKAPKPPVAPPGGGLPPGLKSVETNLLVPLAERADARGDTAMADILRAEYNRRTPESLSQLVERQAGEAPPSEPLFRGQRPGVPENEAGVFYTTPSRKYAQQYGQVSEVVGKPTKPLVVDEAGAGVLSEVTGLPKERILAEGVDRFSKEQANTLRKLGYDAVVFEHEFGTKDGPKVVAWLTKPKTRTAQEGLPELIESQAEADLARRAAKSGNTVADQRMLEGDAQLQQVEQAATELGVPMPRKGERGFVKTEVLTGREGEKGGTTPVPRVRLGDVLDDDGLRAQDQILDRMETPTGRTLTPAETRVDQKFNGVAQGIANVHSRIESILKAMDETASPEQLGNLGQVMGEGMVESGGRMTAPMREARRAAAPPVGRSPDLKISERIEMELKTAITDLETQIKELGGQYSTTAGSTVKKLDPVAYERLLQLKRAYDAVGSEWGRIGRIRQESADTMRRLSRDMGLTLNYLHRRVMEERNPIYTNIGRLVRKSKAGQTVEGLVDDVLKRSKGDKELNKQLSGLTEAEQKQLVRDAVDAWRLNLFSVTSFTLDLFGNIAATASEFAHEAGTDLARAVTGKNAVGIVSMLSGLRRAFRKSPTRVEQEFGLASPQGEAIGTGLGWVGKKGTFTERSNAASALIDNAVGLPLYLKGATDTAFKRAGAWAEIYKQARLEAAKRGLKGAERQKFIEEFSSTMSEADVIKAIDRARRLGFSRELTNLEERMYGSTPYKLFLGAFGRWPSQFVRALGEWVGLSPSLWKRVAAEAKAGNPQEIAGAIGRSLTGLGGLYFLNKTLYPDTDFKSMQYRDPQTGEPIRLAGREPISTGLVLLALMNGDFEKAMDGMKYASIPFANFMAGEGGLLTSLMQRVNSAVKYRKFDSNAVKYELTRTMNKLIPGQAVLGAMKSIFDPTLREGVGSDLPVVSEFLPEKIDPTTGKPIEPRQEFPPGSGIEIPQFGNVPIPGAKIIQDPVSNILGLYGMLDYTMPRRPIAGIPVSDIPREFQRRYMEIAGAEMQKQLGPIARRLMTKRGAIPFGDRQNLLEGYKVYDRLTKGGVSPEEAGKQAFSEKYSVEMSWQEKLKWARALLEDKKLIEAKRNDVKKIAVEKLEQEMRRARREGRL